MRNINIIYKSHPFLLNHIKALLIGILIKMNKYIMIGTVANIRGLFL